MAIEIRKPCDIEQIRKAAVIVAKTLDYLKKNITEGMSLKEIDKLGDDYIVNLGGRPAFKGLYGFPNAVCTSLNEVIIHGVPTDVKIKNGDILGIDIGCELNGWYGDGAITMAIGDISKNDEKLIQCSKNALYKTIDNIKVGMRFKEISQMLEAHITQDDFKPLLNFCGHGIGKKPHSEPEIPNYVSGNNVKQGPKVKNGMVFCLEPMVCQKSGNPIIDKDDKWSVRSEDNLNTSHYEHQIAIINNKAEILTLT